LIHNYAVSYDSKNKICIGYILCDSHDGGSSKREAILCYETAGKQYVKVDFRGNRYALYKKGSVANCSWASDGCLTPKQTDFGRNITLNLALTENVKLHGTMG
jgi:hypothetical protein